MNDPVHPHSPTTVLLIDDDPSTLLLCRTALEREGFVVLQAAGSSEALKLQAEHPAAIHLVVTDVMLPPPDFQLSIANNPFPRVNGLQLVDLLLDSKRTFRIIFMSTSSKEDLLARGLSRANAPFLRKPFTAEAFSALVSDTLAGPPAAKQSKKDGQATTREVDWFG
jgi:CheY-like chemotaxis protein